MRRKRDKYLVSAIERVKHLICICEKCAADDMHLNASGLTVILKKLHWDLMRGGD